MSENVKTTYVINRDQDRDRWESARRQLDAMALPYLRLSAVDGQHLTEQDIKSVVRGKPLLFRWVRDLARPEVGCYLSHRQAWEKIVNEGQGGGFVFEDDFNALLGTADVMRRISALNFGRRPVMVKMYSDSLNWGRNRPLGWCGRPLVGEHGLHFQALQSWGMVAYYVNAPAAAALLRESRWFYRPVDDVVRRVWKTGLCLLTVMPPPVKHGDADSTLGPARSSTWEQVRQRMNVKTYVRLYTLEFIIGSLLYRPVAMVSARKALTRAFGRDQARRD